MTEGASKGADVLLQVDAVTASYGRGIVLRELSIEVPDGSTVAVIGPNGAGKTTLMRCISGILQLSAGAISFAGRPIHRLRANEIVSRGISHVPQGRHLFGTLTVEENLRLGGHSSRRDHDLEQRIRELGEWFPILAERRNAPAYALSGGQQQMVAIARGLMSEPRLLLLDEPSLGLAPKVIDDVANLILGLRKAGQTVLLCEQNVPLAMALANYVYVIGQGTVIARGTPDEVSSLEDVRRTYLGMRAAGDRIA